MGAETGLPAFPWCYERERKKVRLKIYRFIIIFMKLLLWRQEILLYAISKIIEIIMRRSKEVREKIPAAPMLALIPCAYPLCLSLVLILCPP